MCPSGEIPGAGSSSGIAAIGIKLVFGGIWRWDDDDGEMRVFGDGFGSHG